jgi:hypothetical protein
MTLEESPAKAGLFFMNYMKKAMNPTLNKMIPYSQHTNITKIKRHKDFAEAKAGDYEASKRLVSSVFKPQKGEILRRYPNAHIAPVPGKNALPKGLAVHFQYEYTNIINIGFEITVPVNHTGQSAIYRLLNPPVFGGYVTPGQEYFIVDDIMTMGSTIQSFKKYIEANGGIVIGVSVLASSYGGCDFRIKTLQLKSLKARFGLKLLDILKGYGVIDDYEQLTRQQARYLERFDSLYSLRERIREG